MKQIRVVQVGCGKMSKYTMKYVYDHGGIIVGTVDVNPNIIGEDIGFVMETDNKEIVIESVNNLDKLLKKVNADIAIITTMSLLNDIEEIIRIIISNKVNVITTCEEAFFAINSNPTLYKELDILAKSNNVTITGCGYQDIFWGNLISVLAGSTNKITKIKGSSSYNVEDYGIALAEAHGAGLTKDEFNKKIASIDNISEEKRKELIDSREFLPSYMWNTLGWLADKLNLHISHISQKCVPIISDKGIHSETLNMDVSEGNVLGMSAIVTADTEENIELEAECIGKIYNKDEFDKNEWTIIGEPDTTVTINKPCTVELTCADIVNRIPDVINALPGFVSTSQMPEPTYRINNIDNYLQK